MVAILFACFGIVRRVLVKRKKEVEVDPHILQQPKWYIWIGIAVIVMDLALVLFIVLLPEGTVEPEGARIPGCIVLSLPSIIAIIIIFFAANWKITIGEDSFIYRNMFRCIKTYQYTDVAIKEKSASTRVYKEKKKIVTISHFISNYENLQIAIRKYQREQRKGCNEQKENK